MSRCLVVANPAAGRRGLAYTNQVIAALKKHGMDVEVHETTGPGDAVQALRARKELPPLVIAAGGDGTVSEVLNGLAGRDVTLGLIPTGTANVLAIELGYPAPAGAVAAVLARGRSKAVHFATLGQPGDSAPRRFAMMAGVGYDAWVVAGVNPVTKKKFGKLAYVLSMVAQLRRVGSQRYRLRCDGTEHEACSAIISNGRHYAGHYLLARDADISAPELDVVLIAPVARTLFFFMLLLLPLGVAARLPFVRIVKAREVLVETGVTDDPVQADGDNAGTLPVLVRSESTATRVIVP